MRPVDDALKQGLDLVKFKSNLNLINQNELDMNRIEFVEECEQNESDIVFVFATNAATKLSAGNDSNVISKRSYGHLILVYLFLTERDRRELLLNANQSFAHSNRMTILLCLDSNPINNLALYDKIKLICNNQTIMAGQFIQV